MLTIDRQDQIIENILRKYIEQNCRITTNRVTMKDPLDEGLRAQCKILKLDVNVLDTLNLNCEFMKNEEQTLVINSLKQMQTGV